MIKGRNSLHQLLHNKPIAARLFFMRCFAMLRIKYLFFVPKKYCCMHKHHKQINGFLSHRYLHLSRGAVSISSAYPMLYWTKNQQGNVGEHGRICFERKKCKVTGSFRCAIVICQTLRQLITDEMSNKMIFYKVFWCRTCQIVLAAMAYLMPWRKAKVLDGAGCIDELPHLLFINGVDKPLVVTDKGLIEAGVAAQILNILDAKSISYSVFDEVEANPSTTTVEKIREFYLSEKCDCLIAIGGGSPMDAAKSTGARLARPQKSLPQMQGLFKVMKKIPPLFAIPTTAGTGSETTIAAVVTDKESHHKYALMDINLVPLYALLDPRLTIGLPRNITATTGMDALTHAVEAYLCQHMYTKETLQYAKDAVGGIFKNLERACNNPSDLEARVAMLKASYKAGWAFSRSGVGNIHAIAHTLGGLYNTPHGLANAVILPIALEDYGESVHKKLAELSECAGIAGKNKSDAENAAAFIHEIQQMNSRIGIPKGFYNIKDKDIPQMAMWAYKEANPVYAVPVIYDVKRFTKVINAIRM